MQNIRVNEISTGNSGWHAHAHVGMLICYPEFHAHEKRGHATRRLGFALAACLLFNPAALAEEKPNQGRPASSPVSQTVEPTTDSLRGKVVWLADALKRRFGIETDRDAERDIAALETATGELFPLVRDARGRGFWLDPQLRDRELELYVRRYRGSPMVQVIRIYTLRPAGKYELDYWCDVCAIPMYELKACECCQGATRLRERRVPPGGATGTEGDEPADAAAGLPPLETAPAAEPTTDKPA